MQTISYPLRIPEEIMNLAKMRAKDEYTDQSTALRQLLYLGAEDYLLHLVEKGRISIGKAAELLNIPIQDIYQLAQKHGIEIGATIEQQQKSFKNMKKLLKKK